MKKISIPKKKSDDVLVHRQKEEAQEWRIIHGFNAIVTYEIADEKGFDLSQSEDNPTLSILSDNDFVLTFMRPRKGVVVVRRGTSLNNKKTFVFRMEVPSSVWKIEHEIGSTDLTVKVFDANGIPVPEAPIVTFEDENEITLSFPENRIGTALVEAVSGSVANKAPTGPATPPPGHDGHFLPESDNRLDIGAPDRRWSVAHVLQVLGDNVTAQYLIPKGDADIGAKGNEWRSVHAKSLTAGDVVADVTKTKTLSVGGTPIEKLIAKHLDDRLDGLTEESAARVTDLVTGINSEVGKVKGLVDDTIKGLTNLSDAVSAIDVELKRVDKGREENQKTLFDIIDELQSTKATAHVGGTVSERLEVVEEQCLSVLDSIIQINQRLTEFERDHSSLALYLDFIKSEVDQKIESLSRWQFFAALSARALISGREALDALGGDLPTLFYKNLDTFADRNERFIAEMYFRGAHEINRTHPQMIRFAKWLNWSERDCDDFFTHAKSF